MDNTWENLSKLEKERYLIKLQLHTLKQFREKNAITEEQYKEALDYLKNNVSDDLLLNADAS